MSTIRKTITITKKQDKWIKSQIENGDYTNESEYIRDILRREQADREYFLKTKAAIEKGLKSGVSDMDIPAIMEEVEAKLHSDGRL